VRSGGGEAGGQEVELQQAKLRFCNDNSEQLQFRWKRTLRVTQFSNFQYR
jgi:hypothetical protein